MKHMRKLLEQLLEKLRMKQGYCFLLLLSVMLNHAHAVTFTSLVPEVRFSELQSEPVKTSPVVILYTGKGCDACDKLKNRLSCVPQIKFIEKAPGDWVTSIPVLQWQGDDGRWWSMGNHGEGVDLQSFVKEYNGTNPSQIQVAFDVLEAKDIGYPIRGNYWSVGSNWNPSRSQVIYHLQYGSEHSGKFSRSYLDQLSLKELQSLHSDDHEYRVRWASVEKKVNAPKSKSTVTQNYSNSYAAPRRRVVRRRFRSRSRGCPSGGCPL